MLILSKGWAMADREGKDVWDGAIKRILTERASICGGVVVTATQIYCRDFIHRSGIPRKSKKRQACSENIVP